jgi:dolichol-phosphate mannosyltransferase
MAKLISIVFSFRNEQETLAELVRRNVDVLSKEPEDYELVFVNDDSTDRSLEILLELRKADPRIKIVNMSRRFGVYECIMAGFAHARGDAVVYMDSDLQDPPELLPKMIAQWRDGADVVHTTRVGRLGESAWRLWLTHRAYQAIAFQSELRLPVDTGDYKLLSRRAVDKLTAFRESEPYFRGLAVWVGFDQRVVEYVREARAGGVSHHNLLSPVPYKVFIQGLTSFSFVPIYATVLLGLAAAVASFAAAALGAIAALFGAGPGGLAWLAILVVFCWGTGLFALGFLGIYVSRIHRDTRGRPLYIVRELIGLEPPAARP